MKHATVGGARSVDISNFVASAFIDKHDAVANAYAQS